MNADYYINDFGDGKTNWYGSSNIVANAGYVLFLPKNHGGVKLTGIGMVQTNNVTMQVPYSTIPWVGLAYDVLIDMRASGLTNLFPQPRLYSSFNYDFVDSQQTLGGSIWSAEYYIDDWGSRTTNFFPSVTGADKLEPGKGWVRGEALQDFVKQTIAPYKYPRAIEFRTDLPRTETGKLQRFKLRTEGVKAP